MKEILISIASASGAALIIYLGALIRAVVMKKYHSERRESTVISQLVPAVNALLDMQGPQTHALIALLEAQQGKCNGNVEAALTISIKARDKFDTFLRDSARVESVRI